MAKTRGAAPPKDLRPAAAKLLAAAVLIEEVAAKLNDKRHECRSCGTLEAESVGEWKVRQNLDELPARLRKQAALLDSQALLEQMSSLGQMAAANDGQAKEPTR